MRRPKHLTKPRSAHAVGICLAAGFFCLASLSQAEPTFDEQRRTVSISPATQPESAILSLLDAGIEENKPTQAIAVTQRWLRENVAEDPALLYRAAQAAELSGDWSTASSLYLQYLRRADLSTDAAGDASQAAYTLLLNNLGDSESAYAFARSDGHRLVASTQARQFDRWFLDQARTRNDHDAVAARLLALVQADLSGDLLVAQYEQDFRWLLRNIIGQRMDTEDRYSQRFVDNVKALAAGIRFDPQLGLLLDWEISVKAYNFALLDEAPIAPPIAQAQALLTRYPAFALAVQTDWAGGHRGQHYRGDNRVYWPHELQAKLAPVLSAVEQLDPASQAAFYQSYDRGYFSGGPIVINDGEDARAWVLANPELANSKLAPSLALGWNQISFEQAQELAPLLERNPSPEAALIRAVAAGGEEKNFDQAIQALVSTEAWRLDARELSSAYADQLWHWAGRPGGNEVRDAAIRRTQVIAESLAQPDATVEQNQQQRMAAFNRLWSDYRNTRPSLPNVRTRLVQVLRITPEALPQLLRDASPEAQLLARQAIEAGFTSNDEAWQLYAAHGAVITGHYDPCILRKARHHRYNNLADFQLRMPEQYVAHPLEPLLRETLAQQLRQNKVQPWLVLAWLNTQFPEDSDASVELMTQLRQSPVWDQLSYETRYGARDWFPRIAMTEAQLVHVDAGDAELIFADLLAMPADADAATAAAVLGLTLQAVRNAPQRLQIQGLRQVGALDEAVFADPLVLPHLYELIGPMRMFETDSAFGARLFTIINEEREPRILHQTAPYLWRHTEVHHRTLSGMIELADTLSDEHPSAAHTLARCGLQTIARHRSGHTYYNRDTDIPRLRSVLGEASVAMGLINIPVPPSNPAYPIYQSQAEFAIGNTGSARELYVNNADQLMPIHRDLSVSYLLWALQTSIDNRDEARQEELARTLMAWMQESETAFSLEQRVALEIAYGDIALQRGMLPEAHQIYTRIRNNESYESVYTRHTATLRTVLVERISRDYDGAMQTLLQLESEKIPRLTTAAHFARAEVYYDMEEFEDAAEEIAEVLEREPNHADATILRGRVQLRLQRLIEATEVELGSATAQATLVPGEPLKVTLNDPTLTISSGGSDIEVVIWTSSEDREVILLRQFGDERTKYRGELRTTLGEPVPGDRILQLVGDDEVFFDYSDAFRQRMNNLEAAPNGPITIASDAMMMASARQLLSENEQRVADMRAVTEMLRNQRNESIENLDPQRLAELREIAEAQSRREAIEARVKPGNPIYLRVVDYDRGRTAEVDQLQVNVTSSSGDLVGGVVLTETGTHTGVFEGLVNTTEATALAFASSSESGRNPNMIISPRDDYPAWRPVATNNERHHLTVDLNDDAQLGTLQVTASDESYALNSFIVQTAMNNGTWTTVGSYPAANITVEHPWQPTLTVVNETWSNSHSGARSVYEIHELRQHMATGWLAQPNMALAMNVAGPSEALPESVLTQVEWKRQGRWQNPAVIARFEAYFYEPASVRRRFALDLGRYNYEAPEERQNQQPQFLIAVDGRIITTLEGDALAGELDLSPGLHRIEIWATGWVQAIGFGRDITLRANLDDPEILIDCPDSFFDPSTFPEGILEHRNPGAEVTANEDGTQFDVNFAQGSHGRLVRILFAEYEGPVPSVNRITLADPEDNALLPAAADFSDQRRNETLEIITGDTVTVRYVDDRFVTNGRERHERFLNVAYTDGKIEFADIEPRWSGRHNSLQPYRETLLRFPYDQPLSIVVNDADMDLSIEPDTVSCTVTNAAGVSREISAEETGPSTGVFRAWITPVSSAAEEADKIQVGVGESLTVTYFDQENLRPGVPYERIATIRHAAFSVPQIEIAHMTVTDYAPELEPGQHIPVQALNEVLERRDFIAPNDRRDDFTDRITARYLITQSFKTMQDAPEGGIDLVHGRTALIDIVAPSVAVGAASSIEVFVQSDSGRAAHGIGANSTGFDPNVPGTVRLVGYMNEPDRDIRRVPQRGGYVATFDELRGNEYERREISQQTGRFRLALPLITGPLPEISYADPELLDELQMRDPRALVARAGERIHIGVRYTDAQGQRKWATSQANVITRPMLDVMQEDYRTTLTSAHVGEPLHLRVVDTARDTTDERDTLQVYMASRAGERHYATLRETDTHSGVFRGVFQLTFAEANADEAQEPDGEAEPYDVARLGFPVTYGDAVGVRYTDASGLRTPTYFVQVARGSDGSIIPFSKLYDDSETAMLTQFAMAESYLELARRHRRLGEEAQAVREFDRARQMLAATIAQFNDPETRAHAAYLLGNLTMEDAEATEDPQLQRDRYQAALARYLQVTGNYPETEFASMAQFKIAVVYERLGEPDIAAQEYVKLAYKYPESEHLATAMARLGTHFQRRALTYQRQAAPLLEQEGNLDAEYEGQALSELSRREFIKAAQIFERLQSRFPSHELAGSAGLRAGQLYMRAEDYHSALTALRAVIDTESYDGVTLRSEAMYWAGMSFQSLNQRLEAYGMFKRITYDFPESRWAAYARSQLSTEQMIRLDQQLEIQRLEEGQ